MRNDLRNGKQAAQEISTNGARYPFGIWDLGFGIFTGASHLEGSISEGPPPHPGPLPLGGGEGDPRLRRDRQRFSLSPAEGERAGVRGRYLRDATRSRGLATFADVVAQRMSSCKTFSPS